MANETLLVIARVVAQPDRVEELKAVLLDLIEPTRAEPGCVSYQLWQGQTDPGDFVFVDNWASDEAFAAHMVTPHVQEAFTKAQGLLAEAPDIRSYRIVG
jgi:quinol monooxygenase YgiN